MSADYVDAVADHVRRFWPDSEIEPLVWTLGEHRGQHTQFRVLEVKTAAADGYWMYVSAGAAVLREAAGVGHEYVLRSWGQERLHVELVTMVASYSMRADHEGLHDGHTVPIGRPWSEGSESEVLYFNRPYFAPMEFELLSVGDINAHLLWLIPITESERRWRHEHGQEPFEQRLEELVVVPEDPRRDAIA